MKTPGLIVQQPMRRLPQSLVINVTLQCPLKCAHCCYSSDMFQAGHLGLDDVRLAIDQAAAIPSFEIVHFVGGDPLLHPDILNDAIQHCARAGLQTGITTSAYWAKTPRRAQEVVQRLARSGLSELTLSYDDSHAVFIRPAYIAHAASAAMAADVPLRIAVTVEPEARITAASLRADLGLEDAPQVKIYETAINSTGRASETDAAALEDRRRNDAVYRGPCESILRTFQVDHDGRVRPCCGVLPHHDALCVGGLHDGGLAKAVADAGEDALFRWISLVGPVEILAEVTADDAEPLTPERFDGICSACDHMFRSPEMLSRVRAAADGGQETMALMERAMGALADGVARAAEKAS